jgi:hypothetical protein
MKYLFKGKYYCIEGRCPSNSLRFNAFYMKNICYRKGALLVAPNQIFHMAYYGARVAPQQSPVPQISDYIYGENCVSVNNNFYEILDVM